MCKKHFQVTGQAGANFSSKMFKRLKFSHAG